MTRFGLIAALIAAGPIATGLAAPAIAAPAATERAQPAVAVAGPVAADPPVTNRKLAPNQLIMGVGALVTPDYEGSNDYLITPGAAAIIRVAGHAITWQGTSLSIDLVPEHVGQRSKLAFGPYAELNFDRASAPRDPVVSLMRKRKVALEAGGFIGFSRTGVLTSPYDRLSLQISFAHDVGNVSKSFVVTPSIAYLMPVSHAVVLGSTLSGDIVGGRYARYYFGIGPTSSAMTGLPRYQPSWGLKSMSLSLMGGVSLRGDLQKRGVIIGGLLSYKRMLGDFADSPLVAQRGNANQLSAAVGLGYAF